jgi:hypothetical protein
VLPSGFKNSQIASPCYFNTNTRKCDRVNPTIIPVDTPGGQGDKPYPGFSDGTTNVTCKVNGPCIPHLLSTGQWCPNGTVDGKNCA